MNGVNVGDSLLQPSRSSLLTRTGGDQSDLSNAPLV